MVQRNVEECIERLKTFNVNIIATVQHGTVLWFTSLFLTLSWHTPFLSLFNILSSLLKLLLLVTLVIIMVDLSATLNLELIMIISVLR